MESELAGGQGEIELRRYVRVLWRRKFLIAGAVVLCGLIAYQSSSGDPKTYRASTEVLLRPSASEEVFAPDELASSAASRSEIQTVIEVMTSGSVRDAVVDKLGHAPRVSITQQGDTDVVAITASSRSPERAAVDAQTYAETYVTLSRERLVGELLAGAAEVQTALDAVRAEIAGIEAPLTELDNEVLEATDFETRQAAQIRADAARASVEAQLNALRSREAAYSTELDELQLATALTTTGGAQIVTPAQEPGSPSGPRPRRDAATGAALGLVLGVALAFARNHFDDRIRDEADVDLRTPALPVLATVPAVLPWHRWRGSRPLDGSGGGGAAAEGYRRLRTSIQLLDGGKSPKIVMVTSPSSNDSGSVSSVVANVAAALARVGARVVAVDCDLHHPRLHGLFGLPNDVGLASVLTEHVDVEEALQKTPGAAPVRVLTAGPRQPNPSDLLAGRRMREMLYTLAAGADFVVVAAAPVFPVADPLVLSAAVDGVVLVLASGRSRGGALVESLERLEQVRAPVVGAVLTGTRLRVRERLNRYGGLDLTAPLRRVHVPGRTNGSTPEAAAGQSADTDVAGEVVATGATKEPAVGESGRPPDASS